RLLYPEDDGEVLDFTEDPVLNETFFNLKQIRHTQAELNQREAELKQALQQAIGTASKAVFADGSISWKKSRDSVSIDTAALLADHPELKSRSQVSKPGSRRILLSCPVQPPLQAPPNPFKPTASAVGFFVSM